MIWEKFVRFVSGKTGGEFAFSLAMTLLMLVIAWQNQLTEVDEIGINARTLPYTMALIIGGFSCISMFVLTRSARLKKPVAPASSKLISRIIVPIVLEMFVYVFLINLLGYAAATFLIMIAVFLTFGVRNIFQILALSAAAALTSHYLFISLLGMFMPEGTIWQ